LWTARLFVSGFAIVFTALGAGASALSGALLSNRLLLSRIGGAVIIVMGLLLGGFVRVPFLMGAFLMGAFRMDLSRIRPGPAGAAPLGMAFAIGWVPCVGPVLAGILTLAATEASAGRGAFLLAIYSLGLGVPFVALAIATARLSPLVRWLQRHGRRVELTGAVVLIAMGVLLLTDRWIQFFSPLTRLFTNGGWPPI
jgi:cytochrome c-type biogenesis protein